MTLLNGYVQQGHRIICIDGRDGSGKSYLAKQLHNKLGGTRLDEENYREASISGHFQPKTIDLLRDIAFGLGSEPVIYESCFMQWILKKIGFKPQLTIYIKKVSPAGLWRDEDELAYRETEEEAVSEALRMGATPFRIQMIEYHYRFQPHEKADVIYFRNESLEL